MLKMWTLVHFRRETDSILGVRQLARAAEVHFLDTYSFQSVVFHGSKDEENSISFLVFERLFGAQECAQGNIRDRLPKTMKLKCLNPVLE